MVQGLSLATGPRGLVARIQCSHYHSPNSISVWEPKPGFKPLQAEATGDQADRIHSCLCFSYSLDLCLGPDLPVFVVYLLYQVDSSQGQLLYLSSTLLKADHLTAKNKCICHIL